MSYQEKELCKPYLELLMGRTYAKHTTSYLWGGIMQKICHKSFKVYSLYTFFMGRMYANQKQYLYLSISL